MEPLYHKNTILKGYNFGSDWFSRNLQIWSQYLTKFIDKPELNVLEIGSWEGRSTCWLLDHILTDPTAKITCIDTFAGSFKHQNYGNNYLKSIEQKFNFNISITGRNNQVNKIVGESWEKLRSLPYNNYDFIYIDGSHLACDVLEDVILSWRLLKPQGLIIFDDYDFNLAEHE